MQERSDDLTSASKDLGSSAEIDMMTLQSLDVIAADRIVQMATNTMSALGDTVEGYRRQDRILR